MTEPVDLTTLSAETFEQRLNETFTLHVQDGTLDLTLKTVRRLGHAARAAGAFSLMFVAPRGPFLPQMIYRLSNPTLGTLELFLVPIGPEQGGNGYEAVFA